MPYNERDTSLTISVAESKAKDGAGTLTCRWLRMRCCGSSLERDDLHRLMVSVQKGSDQRGKESCGNDQDASDRP